jgi:2-dehydro-3-deoxygluconokinase
MPHKVVTIGEILMRLTAQGNNRFLQNSVYESCFGGTEANVAISLCNFGLEVAHITALPNHDIGKACAQYMKGFGVDTSHFHFDAGRMGLYFLENGTMQRASKIIYDRFDSVFARFDFSKIDYDLLLDGVSWLHYTGISPAVSLSAANFSLKIAQEASKRGITVSADINYRRNLWQYGKSPLEIMPNLIKHSTVLIGGIEDFKNSMNILETDFEKACNLIMEQFPNIKKIANTNRQVAGSTQNTLSAVLYDGKQLFTSKTYEMNAIVDRIGGGDAFMAGLIYGLLHKIDQEALEFAVAASVIKHTIVGDANLCTAQEVEQLVKEENIGKLLR